MIRIAVIVFQVLACGAALANPPQEQPSAVVYGAAVTPCFTLTLGVNCGAMIVAAIDGAQSTLDVQAYNFTAQDIIAAILRARVRGVVVRVILDKISPSQMCEGADDMRAAGIPTFIDRRPKIAHNKVMVIDGQAVITGSFNFSGNAETGNAENANLIVSPGVAAAYEANFLNRLAVSVPYDGVHKRPVKSCAAASSEGD
jgi:phosphatidylserine/phosphatidylglycerophosphate/cardiolipin synthase-like enzyme